MELLETPCVDQPVIGLHLVNESDQPIRSPFRHADFEPGVIHPESHIVQLKTARKLFVAERDANHLEASYHSPECPPAILATHSNV